LVGQANIPLQRKKIKHQQLKVKQNEVSSRGGDSKKEIKEIETKNKRRRNFHLERNRSELMCFLRNSDTIIIIRRRRRRTQFITSRAKRKSLWK
jgi:hypothetical protein